MPTAPSCIDNSWRLLSIHDGAVGMRDLDVMLLWVIPDLGWHVFQRLGTIENPCPVHGIGSVMKLPINDCARKRPLAEGWSLGPARWEPRLKRHSIDFRNSIKSIIFHKLNHASARNMYQNINFMNSNWSLIHHNVYKLYIQSTTYPLHWNPVSTLPGHDEIGTEMGIIFKRCIGRYNSVAY